MKKHKKISGSKNILTFTLVSLVAFLTLLLIPRFSILANSNTDVVFTNPDKIVVEKDTSLENLPLPATIVGTNEVNANNDYNITWLSDTYDPQIIGEYLFKGTVVGYENSNITLIVEVQDTFETIPKVPTEEVDTLKPDESLGEQEIETPTQSLEVTDADEPVLLSGDPSSTIKEFLEDLDTVVVGIGTPFEDVVLPTTLSVQLMDDQIINVPLTWSTPTDYDSNIESNYIFTPTIAGYEIGDGVIIPSILLRIDDLVEVTPYAATMYVYNESQLVTALNNIDVNGIIYIGSSFTLTRQYAIAASKKFTIQSVNPSTIYTLTQSTAIPIESKTEPNVTNNTRHFLINGDITIKNLNLYGQDVTLPSVAFANGGLQVQGGGKLHLDNVTLSLNSDYRGGAIYGAGNSMIDIQNSFIINNKALYEYSGTGLVRTAMGGGIYANSNFTITNTVFEDNVSKGYGGAGLAIGPSGTVNISSSRFSKNNADFYNPYPDVPPNYGPGGSRGSGGAIHVTGKLIADDITLYNNNAYDTGAIYVNNSQPQYFGEAKITNSEIYDNYASNTTGGLTLVTGNELTTSTVRGNVSNGSIGGVKCTGCSINSASIETNSAITGNTGGLYLNTGSLSNTTISGNHTAGNGGGVYIDSLGASIYNDVIIDGNTADLNGAGIAIFTTELVQISQMEITNNEATLRGGGIYAPNNASISFGLATVDNNTAGEEGGGVYLGGLNSQLIVTISGTLNGNSAKSRGGGLYVEGTQSLISLGNTQVNNNTLTGTDGNNRGAAIFITPITGYSDPFPITNMPRLFIGSGTSFSGNNSNNRTGYPSNYLEFTNRSTFAFNGTYLNNDDINYGDAQYRVVYKANNGVATPDFEDSLPRGDDANETVMMDILSIEDTGFTNGTYVFVGWNTAEDGSGQMYQSGMEIEVAVVETLYAQWSDAITVTLKNDLTAVPNANSNINFSYTIQFLDSLNQPMANIDIPYSGSKTGIFELDEDGKATISLKDNEAIVMSGVSNSWKVEITQTFESFYTTTVEDNLGSGPVSSLSTGIVNLTNADRIFQFVNTRENIVPAGLEETTPTLWQPVLFLALVLLSTLYIVYVKNVLRRMQR